MAQPVENGDKLLVIPRVEGAKPGEVQRSVQVSPSEPTTTIAPCARDAAYSHNWQTVAIGADSASEIGRIGFAGNSVFSRETLLKGLLSQEFHWYRFLSRDYLTFRGPFQSYALLELKGALAHEDFGFVPPAQGPSAALAFRDFVLSSEHLYNPDILATDQALLLFRYWANGYVDADVIPAVKPAADGEMAALSFGITEGERYRFGKITLSSNIDQFDASDLRYAVDLKTGEWFDPIRVNRIVAELSSDIFGNLGLFKALGGHLPHQGAVTVKPRIAVDRSGKVVDVTFAIDHRQPESRRPADMVQAKPAHTPAGKRIGVAQGKPAAASRAPKVGALPAASAGTGRIGIASAADGGAN